jgi:hypothetical protein
MDGVGINEPEIGRFQSKGELSPSICPPMMECEYQTPMWTPHDPIALVKDRCENAAKFICVCFRFGDSG